MEYIYMSEATSQQVKKCTITDPSLQVLMITVINGRPKMRQERRKYIREYWTYRDELTVQYGIIYKGMRVIIPKYMRPQMIALSHSLHLGADACVRWARDVIFWPSVASDIRENVQSCDICNDYKANNQKEPLMTHQLPESPRPKFAQDLFSLHGDNYLVTVDYYSGYLN
ncbi:hypothetical protein LSH36_1116g00008 [Paralvinella palmiformis]|uniref:Integrase zinc-binding domain-containing protein n=1 Tax=Paralvinella palmiformis TaxID=53620 RepID=A0AAD9IWH2_9ANNE|nr:hypothetical protein LSH36_1116g00008 [Paralvinella palmiformis]